MRKKEKEDQNAGEEGFFYRGLVGSGWGSEFSGRVGRAEGNHPLRVAPVAKGELKFCWDGGDFGSYQELIDLPLLSAKISRDSATFYES